MHPLIKTYTKSRLISTHKVLRNTYALLGLTFFFSALCATASVLFQLPAPNFLISIIGIYGLMFAVHIYARSALGILFVFLFTGFMGYSLCPLLNVLLQSSAGTSVLITALLGTSVSFIGLSCYALVTEEDFSFLHGFVFVALIGCIVCSAFGLIFNMYPLNLLAACAMTVISCATILYQTSDIIHGGETNYILATVGLYVSLYNLFVSLIQILSAFQSRD